MEYLIRQKWNIKGTSFGKKNVCLLTYAYDTVYSLSDLKKKTRQEYDASPLSICQIFRPKTKLLLNQSHMDRVKY